MDRELEALRKTRVHVADVAELAEMAREHLREGARQALLDLAGDRPEGE